MEARVVGLKAAAGGLTRLDAGADAGGTGAGALVPVAFIEAISLFRSASSFSSCWTRTVIAAESSEPEVLWAWAPAAAITISHRVVPAIDQKSCERRDIKNCSL